MTSLPFTDDGVRSKIQELYLLPDGILRAETESLRADLRTWMHRQFDLNEEQDKFLEEMEYPSIQILAEDLADCINFRLPLTVYFGPKVPIGSKFVMPRSDLIRSYHPIKGYEVKGQLRIEIIYVRK